MESKRPSSVPQVLTELTDARNPEKNACAEIKYDGERMQIHVKRNAPREDQIRIFSKSGRNSTMDRSHTHRYIFFVELIMEHHTRRARVGSFRGPIESKFLWISNVRRLSTTIFICI